MYELFLEGTSLVRPDLPYKFLEVPRDPFERFTRETIPRISFTFIIDEDSQALDQILFDQHISLTFPFFKLLLFFRIEGDVRVSSRSERPRMLDLVDRIFDTRGGNCNRKAFVSSSHLEKGE
jgi:hypothetical protein